MAKKARSAAHYISVADKHLEKVERAWDKPTDWADLATYGLYCLEALIQAAAIAAKMHVEPMHWQKADVARRLHRQHGLSNVSDLMADLNEARKANAYGDTDFDESEFDAADIATNIESFHDEVVNFVKKHSSRKPHP